MNVAALAVPRDDYGAPNYSPPQYWLHSSLPRGSRQTVDSAFDPWQYEVSYLDPPLSADLLLTGYSAVAAPTSEMVRAETENLKRGFPPAYNKKETPAPSTQGTASAAPAEAAFDMFSRRRRWGDVRPYRVFEAAAGRHRQQRAAVISPRRLTAAAVFLVGRKRGAVHHEWRSHLSDLTRQGLSSRDQTCVALGFLWAALRLRLRDAAKLACGPVDALLRSRTLSNLLVLIPTWMAALYILRHLGTLGVVTSAESISAIGGGLYGLIRGGRWWRKCQASGAQGLARKGVMTEAPGERSEDLST